ncbi:MAG: DUF4252 domain-containing protein [Muribaculaceae bacterium]|nr:DUF4252 domain-containing protein [Muribaculaceae bacterium]MDE7109942.1 DUF4252 domain-containing protein [Muribaculaceae bacterium]
MYRLLSAIIIFLAGISAASAASPTLHFSPVSTREGFDYTYVSPSMLAMMGDKVVNSDLNIKASDINSIETVYTPENGTDTELWNIIRSLKSRMKLETLTTNKQGDYRYDVLGRLSGDRKYITNLMVITQNTGANVTVVYIEGKIPLSEVMLQY